MYLCLEINRIRTYANTHTQSDTQILEANSEIEKKIEILFFSYYLGNFIMSCSLY